MNINGGGDFIRFNNFFISPNGNNTGIGTYSSTWNFFSGSASVNGTASHQFNPIQTALSGEEPLGTYASASFRLGYTGTDELSYGANITMDPEFPIHYYNISSSVNYTVNVEIQNPSNNSRFLIVKRLDTGTYSLILKLPSGVNFRLAGQASNSATKTLTSTDSSIRMIYNSNIWYEI
jgi:hypothetical protein